MKCHRRTLSESVDNIKYPRGESCFFNQLCQFKWAQRWFLRWFQNDSVSANEGRSDFESKHDDRSLVEVSRNYNTDGLPSNKPYIPRYYQANNSIRLSDADIQEVCRIQARLSQDMVGTPRIIAKDSGARRDIHPFQQFDRSAHIGSVYSEIIFRWGELTFPLFGPLTLTVPVHVV